MAGAAARPRCPAIPGQRGPAIIAHSAGNTRRTAREGLAAGADYIEVDLFVHRGQFESRHERRLPFLPFFVEKWSFRPAPRNPFPLSALLGEAAPPAGVFLDLKNAPANAPRLVREAVLAAAPSCYPVASSQDWDILRGLATVAPEVALFYSIDVQAQLDLFLAVGERDTRPLGVSCRESLVTRQLVESLHERALRVVAWTVDDLERAAELAAWGVDGITTRRVAAVRARLAPAGVT